MNILTNQDIQLSEFKIYKTKNYDLFKYLVGNRSINQSSVLRKEESINNIGFQCAPIIVNENFEIIDGQHRFNALKNLGKEIHFVVSEGAGIDEVTSMNTSSKCWSVRDYLNRYVAMGYSEYVDLNNFWIKNNYLSLGQCIILLSGAEGCRYVECSEKSKKEKKLKNIFRFGEYTKRISINRAQIVADYMSDIKEMASHPSWTKLDSCINKMCIITSFMRNYKDVDFEKFKYKIQMRAYTLTLQGNIEDTFKEIQDVYFYKHHGRKENLYEMYKQYLKNLQNGMYLED